MDVLREWLGAWERLLVGQGPRLAWVLAFFVAVTAVERLWPAERGQGFRGRIRNLVIGAVFVLLGHAALAVWTSQAPLRIQLRPASGLPTSVAFAAGYVVLVDFFYYWYHRAQHRFRFLWAVHEIHHSDAEMNVTTSFRTWFLEIPAQLAFTLVPTLWILGPDGMGMAIYTGVATFFLLFTHVNVPLNLGPLTAFVAGPATHRIHHSLKPEHRDRNFATAFMLWDVIFGTYRAPRPGEIPPTGTDELRSDAPVLVAETRPFNIWWRLLTGPKAERGRRPSG